MSTDLINRLHQARSIVNGLHSGRVRKQMSIPPQPDDTDMFVADTIDAAIAALQPKPKAWTVQKLDDLCGLIGTAIRQIANTASAEQPHSATGTPFQAVEGDSALYVCGADGGLLGLVILRDWPEEKTLWLGMAWTEPAFRRQGIYRSLLQAAVLEARARKVSALQLGISPENELSIRVHLALGARPTQFDVRLDRDVLTMLEGGSR